VGLSFCGSSDTLRTRNSRLAKPDSKPKAVVAKMLRDRTRARLVQIQSLIEAGADARETSDRVHALSNATLVDALQHPDATLRILTGEPDNAQTDQDALIAACNGDVELANDLFHSAGRNLQVALSLVQSSSTSDSDANFAHNSVDPVVDLTDGVSSKAQDSSTGNNKSGSSGSLSLSAQEADDLEALVNFCQGDRDLARDVFENVGRDLPKALQFLGM